MRKKLLCLLTGAALLLAPGFRCLADSTNAAAITDLTALVSHIKESLQNETNRTEAAQAGNIKQFDVLLDKYKDDTSDDRAVILYMKAKLYLEAFSNYDKGIEIIQQIQHDFPASVYGTNADKIIANIQKEQAVAKIQAALAVNTPFPDFDVLDLEGKPLSVSKYKGKVVLVDFWATWCVPCLREVPNIVEAYEKYHDKGLEVIGVNLDDADDKDKMTSYAKDHKMNWPEYFDGQNWTNKLAVKYGVHAIPMTFLLDRDGKIIAKGDALYGEAVGPAIAKAVDAK